MAGGWYSLSEFDSIHISSLTPSRILRKSDYDALIGACDRVDRAQALVNPPHPHQHEHRRWEQALCWAAVARWMAEKGITTYRELNVSDWGHGVGLLPAMFVAAGATVFMNEPWVYGREIDFVVRQLEQVADAAGRLRGRYVLTEHPCLCELVGSMHEQFDISLCISTIEHIGEEEKAFRDLCQTVRPGGMIFLTMDFADSDGPHQLDYMRCRMYTKELMKRLGQWGSEMGFRYLGGAPEWNWTEDCRIVLDYGFASIAMVKENNGR